MVDLKIEDQNCRFAKIEELKLYLSLTFIVN